MTAFMPPSLRLPNYFTILLICLFLSPFITRGARFAVQTNNNNVADWLPDNYAESTVLMWFHKHFMGESFAVVSWDGCTLGDTQKLDLLVKKIRDTDAEAGQPGEGRKKYFKNVLTGPAVLEQLTAPPLSLDYDEAIGRIEGALVGPLPEGGENADRVTCAVVMLSEEGRRDNKAKRAAIEALSAIAIDECGIPKAHFHMGGPPVDNVTIDIEGERTLVKLAGLAGLMGFGLSYLCFRSLGLTMMVFLVGGFSAFLSLAVVFYFSVFEVFALGYDKPHLGTVDAILMSMPAVVYVLGLSGAIHIVNYYRDAIREQGMAGAAEIAVRHGWKPCALAALTTAVGLFSLYISDIIPIRKFGLFTAIGVIGTLALIFTVLPACLHRFGPKNGGLPEGESQLEGHHSGISDFMHGIGRWIIQHNGWVGAGTVAVMVLFGYGMSRIQTEVQLLKLFDPNADIIHDYRWLETHLGNLVPVEVIVKLDAAHVRTGEEDAEADGENYRLNLLERIELVEKVQHRVEDMEHVGRAMTAVTFSPNLDVEKSTAMRVLGLDPRVTVNNKLEEHRDELVEQSYIRDELNDAGEPTGGKLLRVSARMAALADVDYGLFVADIQKRVEPVLSVYRQRDEVVRALHAKGKRLRLSNVVVLFENDQANPDAEAAWRIELLAKLLDDAGVRGYKQINLARMPTDARRPAVVKRLQAGLALRDVVINTVGADVAAAKEVTEGSQLVVNVTAHTDSEQDLVTLLPSDPDAPAISAAYTGLVPLVYKTQRQLLISLQESMAWACGLIALVMVVVFRSFSAGVLTMIPNVFPIVLIFGGMGLLGMKVDIGTMMTASVALGVAVDDTVHYLTWFRDGIQMGMTRKEATMLAYERCGSAMLQTTIVGGLGLSVFAVSSFMPTHQFGILMGTLLAAALIGDLVVLPALLAGPLGRFFISGIKVQPPSESHDEQPPEEQTPTRRKPVTAHLRHDAPHRSAAQ